MERVPVDVDFLKSSLLELLAIPSPTGLTDAIVHYTGKQLDRIGVRYELTRRGTIRAILPRNMPERRRFSPACAIAAHLDTLGAMVAAINSNGRLLLMPVGTWSSRWAEGGRVTIFTENGSFRGSVLPLMASGHVYNEAVDTQPVTWDQLEVRVDAEVYSAQDTAAIGIQVGDFVAFDPNPEILENGFIVSRHLDNKAGAAALLTAMKAAVDAKVPIPMNCHCLFTLTEEVGLGARAGIDKDVSEVIGVDIGPVATGQGARELGVTIPLMDSAGPHDFHLTRRLLALCREYGIPSNRDVFRYYHSDAGAAVSAGHDVRTALLCFGTDASHGYERTHLSSLVHLAELLVLYMQAGPTLPEDRHPVLESVDDFSHQLDADQMARNETPLPDAGSIVE
ncbi:peptidase M42 family hydrolase [Paucimonas lemoignei]|uniref:Peptidase M42 family hydrolase n=1 Tax=Paucimonas lemoignei TaxID=29443 RepID=A0A4R3HVP2_PAULE|nr:osmoprotectant NAGGN system M42 family peptidase [Paucimonas lemoignei]TCS36291.1 peptidase M42 family hydrolase [Paucimonas lemoignei]